MNILSASKLISCLCVLFLFWEPARAQTRNFIQQDIITVPGVKTVDEVHQLPSSERRTVRTYMDGFGRQVQTVHVKASPTQRDIISAVEYDKHGRAFKEYLPYTSISAKGSYRDDASADAQAFYATQGQKTSVDTKPYRLRLFDNSPLSLLLKEGSFGNGYQTNQNATTHKRRGNQSGEVVRRWNPAGAPLSSYGNETLIVNETILPDGQHSITYTDKTGNKVMQKVYLNEVIEGTPEAWLETYYVYDDLGRLVFVIPPNAVIKMRKAGNYNLTSATVESEIFTFKYNDKGQEIERREPSSGTVYKIYDPLDRLVLVQDEQLRPQKKWYYIKYSVNNIPISHGIYTDNTRLSRTAMQSYVSQLAYSGANGERRASSLSTGYYTNTVFPTVGIEPLAYAYFNDYDLNKNGSPDLSYQHQGMVDETTATAHVHGRATMLRQRSIGSGLSNIWETSAYFYDKDGQLIQTRSNNHLNTATEDSETVVRDFVGKVSSKKTIKKIYVGTTSKVTSVDDRYAYDHQGRLLNIEQRYNSGTYIRIASYEYNEVGQLVDKKLHSTNGGTSHLQSVDYRYTVNGQLRSINHSSLGIVSGVNDDSNDLFGMELFYEQSSPLGSTPSYSGQLTAVTWRSKTQAVPNPKERGYAFSYDKANRFKHASYKDRPSGGTWGNTGAFDEGNISFDANGNLLTLRRKALLGSSMTEIDNLQYTYSDGKLSNVTDGTGAAYTGNGFRNLTGSSAQYVYNSAGKLTSDPKKGLSLEYNEMGLTAKITITTHSGRYMTYTYSARGELLRTRQYDNGALQTTTDYIDGFVYVNGNLSYFGMAEGKVRNNGGTLKPEYVLTDHQGNARVSFEEQGGVAVVRQENSYYPFGLIMPGNTHPGDPNRQLYNGGAEWQNNYGNLPDLYRTAFRMYDAALGRFLTPDPLALASAAHGTYHYAMGNPIMFNDPLGLKSESKQGEFQPFWDVALSLTRENGGRWSSSTGWVIFESSAEGFYEGAATMARNEAWGLYPGWAYSYGEAAANYNGGGNRSQVSSAVSSGGYVIAGGYYRTASGAPTTVNGASGNFAAYYVGGNGSENVRKRHKSSFGDALAFTDSHFNGALGTVGVAVQGYNKLPNDIKRTYAYKLSKMTGAKSGKIFQGAKSFANGTGKLVSKLGPVGTVLGAGVVTHEVVTGTWDAHTVVNASLMVGAGFATIFGAPVVLTGIAIYGVGDYFFDFGESIDKTVGRNSSVWGL